MPQLVPVGGAPVHVELAEHPRSSPSRAAPTRAGSSTRGRRRAPRRRRHAVRLVGRRPRALPPPSASAARARSRRRSSWGRLSRGGGDIVKSTRRAVRKILLKVAPPRCPNHNTRRGRDISIRHVAPRAPARAAVRLGPPRQTWQFCARAARGELVRQRAGARRAGRAFLGYFRSAARAPWRRRSGAGLATARWPSFARRRVRRARLLDGEVLFFVPPRRRPAVHFVEQASVSSRPAAPAGRAAWRGSPGGHDLITIVAVERVEQQIDVGPWAAVLAGPGAGP